MGFAFFLMMIEYLYVIISPRGKSVTNPSKRTKTIFIRIDDIRTTKKLSVVSACVDSSYLVFMMMFIG